MNEKIKSVMKVIENTMACTAFAEAGEPCPLNMALQDGVKKKSIAEEIEDSLACTAFAEAGEPCPINQG